MKQIIFLTIIIFFNSCSSIFVKDKVTIVKEFKKEGLITQSGKVILKPIYDTIIPLFDDKYYKVKYRGKFGIADRDGNMLLKPKYDEIKRYRNNFLKIKNNGKFGLLDSNFKLILKVIYSDIIILDNSNIIVGINN